ncbi:MAG TPA: hypothetical protein VMG41_15805 [Gemmatimonadales bacterium]|nr:hypothetical protein [Gemmatimonadales bacterium]
MTRRPVMVGLALVAWLALGTTRRLAAQGTVSKVVVAPDPSAFSGLCPAEVTFHGVIVVSEPPVTVEYRWERSDGVVGPRQKVRIAGSRLDVTDSWKLGESGNRLRVWETLHVFMPNAVTSRPVPVLIECA